MKILAPVNSYESAKALITAGAGEIYLGADDQLFNCFSFTGRGKYSYNGEKILCDFKEVKRIVEYAHYRQVQVNFLCNYQFFVDGKYQQETFKYYLDKYIESALTCQVDSIVIGDLGILEYLSQKKIPTALHASVYFKSVNEQQLLFFKELGVKRTVLSYQIQMEEIRYLASQHIMELEVIGYMGCSFYNGSCNFLHDYGEGVKNNFDPGVSCKGKYKINDDECSKVVRLFDSESGCALCVLGHLDTIGVETLKIVGRERNYRQTEKIIKLYCDFLNSYREGMSILDLQDEIPLWWRRLWCSKKRCKYNENNENFKYMIGV